MNAIRSVPLLVGEVGVDVTVTPRGEEQKLRMGGIAHAARGFWACKIPFAAAAVLPHYLEAGARRYLASLGCVEFVTLGEVIGAPNVTLIFDPTEVDDQEYDTLLRHERSTVLKLASAQKALHKFSDVLVFPGSYDLPAVCAALDPKAKLHMDIAYDVADVAVLRAMHQPFASVLISTSSQLFLKIGNSGINQLATSLAPLKADVVILKENRGGSRLHVYAADATHAVPAQLSQTANSVGVGDVFAAAFVAHAGEGPLAAAWRATYASAAYAQTTDPDVFATIVKRNALLTVDEMIDLGGVSLPWEERQQTSIYLAAPDFATADRRALERADSSLKYHNFRVRRPVQENGELPPNSDLLTLQDTYYKDTELIDCCHLMFAVPTGRDPGTLVEIGLAIARRMPVVVYDPSRECANTMVIAGSDCYSDDLDTCLNATFALLSKARLARHG
jgi:nucleoside 2-deoxyribosyltransferase